MRAHAAARAFPSPNTSPVANTRSVNAGGSRAGVLVDDGHDATGTARDVPRSGEAGGRLRHGRTHATGPFVLFASYGKVIGGVAGAARPLHA